MARWLSAGERRRAGVVVGLLTLLVLAAGAQGASGATLSVNAGCYVFATKTLPTMVVTGAGYTPGDLVSISSNVSFVAASATADAAGNIAATTTAPLPPKITAGAQPVVLTAEDGPITASAPVSVAYLYAFHGGAKKRPGLGAFREKTSWSFSGFTPGKYIWGHYLIHRHQVARVRFGKAKGPCGVLKTRARLYPRTPHFRSYPVQVDNSKRYSRHSFPKVSGRLSLTTAL